MKKRLGLTFFLLRKMSRFGGVLATLAAAGICGTFAFVYHWRRKRFVEKQEEGVEETKVESEANELDETD